MLCVAAVVCAARGKATLAGILVMLAVVNKSWALVAVPVVLAVMPTVSRRAIALVVTGAGAVVLLVAAAGVLGVHALSLTGGIGNIFNPPQLLWWLGRHSWIVQKSRALILIVAIACAVVWRLGRERDLTGPRAVPDALLLLALVLFARAAFDPWDNLYYHEPFLFALIAYEATSGRLPALTALYSILLAARRPTQELPADVVRHPCPGVCVRGRTDIRLADRAHLRAGRGLEALIGSAVVVHGRRADELTARPPSR